jgi:signal transduction histidine kinase
MIRLAQRRFGLATRIFPPIGRMQSPSHNRTEGGRGWPSPGLAHMRGDRVFDRFDRRGVFSLSEIYMNTDIIAPAQIEKTVWRGGQARLSFAWSGALGLLAMWMAGITITRGSLIGGAPVNSAPTLGEPRPFGMQANRRHKILEHAVARYGIAFGFVLAAIAVMHLLEALTGRFLAFPFYAAIVAAAWFGTGPGCLSFILSALVVEDIATPPLFSLRTDAAEIPSLIVFVISALMCLAWSLQRRRAQYALEATVQQRTADLLRSNAALQIEIAEREAAEKESRRSETLLAQGQKLSRTASWTLQLPEGDMRWSAQLFDILGFDRASQTPSYRLFTERMHPGDRPRFAEAVEQAIGGGGDFSCETRIVIPGGPTKYVQAVGEVRHGAAGGVEFFGTTMDLTERKRTEQALRDAEAELARTLRLATVAELAAAIAHEINQPLAAITANGSACLRSLEHQPPMLDNARESAACIVADGHRAGDVIGRIRALFSKEEPTQQLLDVNDIVHHVLDLSRGAIDQKRVVARTELASAPLLVMGDPVQLRQVVVNLVTNALEAMIGVVDRPLLLTVRSEIERGEAVVLTVEDSGRGLDPEQVLHIFDSFYTTKPDGIGVGLAISRSIIEAHGGSLWALPGMECGARVGFTLPLAAAAVD